jgi:hypothetical protein
MAPKKITISIRTGQSFEKLTESISLPPYKTKTAHLYLSTDGGPTIKTLTSGN